LRSACKSCVCRDACAWLSSRDAVHAAANARPHRFSRSGSRVPCRCR
jgi:hypothetical protein